MDDIRRTVIEATKKELSEKPFDNGKRQTVIGFVTSLFDSQTDEEVQESMVDLGKDFHEYGLKLERYGSHPNMVWAAEYDNRIN